MGESATNFLGWDTAAFLRSVPETAPVAGAHAHGALHAGHARTDASAHYDEYVSTASAPEMAALPAWLTQPAEYDPVADRDGFLRKNALKLTALLSRLKAQRGGLVDVADLGPLDQLLARVTPAARMVGVFVLIVLSSLASHMMYVYLLLACILVELALKRAEDLVDVLKPAVGAMLFAVVIMAPAVLLGQTESMLRVGLKVFISVAMLACMARSYQWHEIVQAFRVFHVPHLVIFVFDTTLKYIVMLGEVAHELFDALACRSVGRNTEKTRSASYVMGVTFLKAHEFSREMHEAMECRGFTGTYEVPRSRKMNSESVVYLVLVAALVVVFPFLG